MRVAKDEFDRVGTGTIGRQPEQLEAGMRCQPAPDSLRLVDFVIVHDHIDSVIVTSRITALQTVEQIPKELIGFTWSETVVNRSGAKVPSTRCIVFLVLAGSHDLYLRALRHPLIPALGQKSNVQLIGKQQSLPRP